MCLGPGNWSHFPKAHQHPGLRSRGLPGARGEGRPVHKVGVDVSGGQSGGGGVRAAGAQGVSWPLELQHQACDPPGLSDPAPRVTPQEKHTLFPPSSTVKPGEASKHVPQANTHSRLVVNCQQRKLARLPSLISFAPHLRTPAWGPRPSSDHTSAKSGPLLSHPHPSCDPPPPKRRHARPKANPDTTSSKHAGRGPLGRHDAGTALRTQGPVDKGAFGRGPGRSPHTCCFWLL